MKQVVQELIPNVRCEIAIEKGGFTAVSNPDSNTGYIYVGDNFLTTSQYLIRLVPGDLFIFEHKEPVTFYVLNSVAGEKCLITTWV